MTSRIVSRNVIFKNTMKINTSTQTFRIYSDPSSVIKIMSENKSKLRSAHRNYYLT